MANVVYARGCAIVAGPNGWLVGTYGVLLATTVYIPNPTSHHYVADVAPELAGGGYARVTLSGLAIAEDDIGGKADFKANAAVFSGLTSLQTYRWAIVYRSTGVDATSELLLALDMTAVSLTGLTSYTLQWDGQAGLGRVFSVSP